MCSYSNKTVNYPSLPYNYFAKAVKCLNRSHSSLTLNPPLAYLPINISDLSNLLLFEIYLCNLNEAFNSYIFFQIHKEANKAYRSFLSHTQAE